MNDRINERLNEALRMKAALNRDNTAQQLADGKREGRREMGWEKVPTFQMINQCQQLKEQILPRIAQKMGAESADYTMWSGVLNSLLWAIQLNDRCTQLELKYLRARSLGAFYMEQNAKLEAELLRFTTMEDFLTRDFYTTYLTAAATSVENQPK